jgi:hypothetical protein
MGCIVMFKGWVKCPLEGGQACFFYVLRCPLQVAPTGCSSVTVGKLSVGRLITLYAFFTYLHRHSALVPILSQLTPIPTLVASLRAI